MPNASPRSRSRHRPRALATALVAALVAALALLGGARAFAADEEAPDAIPRSEKWYEQSQDGNKTGYIRVVWSPSTWKGQATVHDTTTFVNSSTRNMGGMRDTFSVTTTTDLERALDGTMWWTRTRVEEPERVTLSEIMWTGKGYRFSSHIIGQEANRQVIEVPLEKPVMTDAESFLGTHIRAGTLKAGSTYDLRGLDLRSRAARVSKLTVQGRVTIEDEKGAKLETWKVVDRDPAAGSETLMWMDDQGVLVQLRIGTVLIGRTTQAKAEQMPTRPAEYAITVPASPRLERIFSADRTVIDVHVRPDEHRKLPEFPTSPWSRTLEVIDRGEDGSIIRAELTRYDNTDVKATIPLVAERFARWLEPTAQMQVADPLVVKTVRDVIGEETDARAAAYKLARFVFTKLEKQSLPVAQGDAVQILKACRGDCSEHGLLFVTLCRAAGIPARRCSGFVCIGGMWGAHAWAEIWTGAWIGADPTTGEIGTGARYLFYGYPDEPESYPGVVSSRARGRIRILTRRIEEGKAAFDLADPSGHRIYDREGRRYLHVLAGLEAREVPADWRVTLSDDREMRIRGPDFSAQLKASADQGSDREGVRRYFPGKVTTWAGAPAIIRKTGSARMILLFSRRRVIQLSISGGNAEVLTQLETVLAPTFAVPALAWDAAEEAAAPPEKKAEDAKK
ncbi:MAG: transglutaminase domain-containing protein [Planctomycetota bacterium]|nr:transglutaminase domain-containing protein [Planctomycetota bacterium]